MLNLGNSDARHWWLEHVDKLIVEQGIDLYRNDFNIDPLPLHDLNWFQPTERFYATRTTRLRTVIAALERLERGESIGERVVTRRYAAGLPGVPAEARGQLLSLLSKFVE